MSEPTATYPVVKIDDEPVLAEATWSLSSGTRPRRAVFRVAPDAARRLLEGSPRPSTLLLGKSGRFDAVYPISAGPREVPAIGMVELADRRFWWEYAYVRRRYNVRRAVGVKRLADPTQVVAVPVVPEIQYLPTSLRRSGQPWTAREVLEDVFAIVSEPESLIVSRPRLVFVDPINEIPVENLELDAQGPDALDQVLRYLPGAEIRMGRDGNVEVYNRARGGEDVLFQELGPPVVGQGLVDRISYARQRPCWIDVCFTREIELRFNFREYAPGETFVLDPDGRWLENVLALTDFSLALPGRDAPLCEGSYVVVNDALTAWGAAPGIDRVLEPRDLQIVLVPYMNLAVALAQAGILRPSADWMGRIGSLQGSYRQVYRINRRWMDRIEHLIASRVGVADTVTGTRGAAAVYTDFWYLPTERALFMQAQANADLTYGANVAGYPADGVINSSTTHRAPADLVVVDEDQGILRVEIRPTASRVFEQGFPSQIELEGDDTAPGTQAANGGPCGDLRQRTRSISYDAIGRGQRHPKLTSRYACAVVLTAVPSIAPDEIQDNRQIFHVVRVRPGDVPAFAGQDKCLGPPMTQRVGAGIETAKVAWRDDKAEHIERAFGVRAGVPELEDVTLNSTENATPDRAGGASLQAIARAVAARTWHAMADRRVGAMTGAPRPNARPEGWVPEVEFGVQENGVQWTRANFPGVIERLDLLRFLDSSTQRILLHLVQRTRS